MREYGKKECECGKTKSKSLSLNFTYLPPGSSLPEGVDELPIKALDNLTLHLTLINYHLGKDQ